MLSAPLTLALLSALCFAAPAPQAQLSQAPAPAVQSPVPQPAPASAPVAQAPPVPTPQAPVPAPPLPTSAPAEAPNSTLPVIKLSYASYRANYYDPRTDVYVFRNIRFGAPPLGSLRFAKPAPPPVVEGVQENPVGYTCTNAQVPFPGVPEMAFYNAMSEMNMNEDCLFLNLFVPKKQFEPGAKSVPVVNWIFGGAYNLGSKDNYNQAVLVKAAENNMIAIAANYRLGAFGWMAGSTMEEDATANAGLYDQRAVFEWIQKEIHVVNGDKNSVTAFGESAGGGSIMHHLTAFGGKQDPLFHRAILQSPAFQPLYDRDGNLEATYQRLLGAVGCAGKGMACLRNVNGDLIERASASIISSAPDGSFGFGPSPDGAWVRQMPSLEFATGNYWKNLSSILITHVRDEAKLFVQPHIVNDAIFTANLNAVLPVPDDKNKIIQNAILAQYPATGFPTPDLRVKAFLQDMLFTCNVRFIADAYTEPGVITKTYAGTYTRGIGLHGTDMAFDFYSPQGGVWDIAAAKTFPGLQGFAQSVQSYLAGFAISGDPNAVRLKTQSLAQPTVDWPLIINRRDEENLANVLESGDSGFGLVTDFVPGRKVCEFWKNVYAGMTSMEGYAAPGAVVESTLLKGTGFEPASASKNFQSSRPNAKREEEEKMTPYFEPFFDEW
ncbi:alpha/beta-hydrolase [Aulographum hederae CBS 113979]|uniref:Alpha/beta-hydrolase n=1 Tax=Aulographum hederae CBS 113979 TaxID=1176131 RepID=A0A6G1H304_9PEZI|nr:alpha/beta-hydrolase [Aulographum hederae CBS 113979]